MASETGSASGVTETAEPPSRILVPVDLSERSELAAHYAAMLARSVEAELVFMMNLNLPEVAALEQYARSESTTVQAVAHDQLDRLGKEVASDVDHRTIVTEREYPADAILDAGTEAGVDMIVIASHGRGGMTRWLLGSVAEKIARGANVPVVIVPARSAEVQPQ